VRIKLNLHLQYFVLCSNGAATDKEWLWLSHLKVLLIIIVFTGIRCVIQRCSMPDILGNADGLLVTAIDKDNLSFWNMWHHNISELSHSLNSASTLYVLRKSGVFSVVFNNMCLNIKVVRACTVFLFSNLPVFMLRVFTH
jgi:hypothetical protein